MLTIRHVLAATLLGAAIGCGDEPTALKTAIGRPPSRIVATTPDAVTVGKLIFFDTRLSANGNQSCAACHAPDVGWTGPNQSVNSGGAVYEGSIAGRFGNRKPPSSAYATPSPVFHLDIGKKDQLFVGGNFWDGRATGEILGCPAAEQAQGPFLNPVEQALADASTVVGLVCSGPYGALFTIAWSESMCQPGHVNEAYDAIGMSVAAYEDSPASNAFSSKYDSYLAKKANLDPEEHLGLALFRGKAKCAACHTLDGGRGEHPLFTDFTYDNVGIPKNPANPWYASPLNPQGTGWIDPGLGGFLETRSEYAALAPENMGKFKVPTLRNVDLRPSPSFVKPFGHNGYFKSLKGIVHFYNTRDVLPSCGSGMFTEAQAVAAKCWPAPEVSANLNRAEMGNLKLSEREEWAIVAFLKTLSDGYQP